MAEKFKEAMKARVKNSSKATTIVDEQAVFAYKDLANENDPTTPPGTVSKRKFNALVQRVKELEDKNDQLR